MLKIFRNNVVFQIVVILVVSIVMWSKAWVNPVGDFPEGGGSLFYWITGLMSPRVAAIVAWLLVIGEGVLLNSIMYQHRLITQSTLLPLLLYVVAMSSGTLTLTPMMVGMLFVLLGLQCFFLMGSQVTVSIDKIFGASASIGMAILLCPTMAVMVIPLVACMFSHSLYGWRDWTMLVLGLAAPFILIETYYFVCDELFYRNYLLVYALTDFSWHARGGLASGVISGVFVILLLWGVLFVAGGGQSHSLSWNRNVTTVLLFAVGGVLHSAYTGIWPVDMQALSVPFACCTGMLLAEPRRKEFGMNVVFVVTVLLFAVVNWVI